MGIVNKIDSRMSTSSASSTRCVDWIGDAQQAYTVAKQRWDGAIHDMRELLHNTSQQVTQSNAEYRAADARGARSFDM